MRYCREVKKEVMANEMMKDAKQFKEILTAKQVLKPGEL